MPTVETPYGKLFYAQRAGATPPLFLLHGAGSSHLAWSAELRRLPGRWVIAPDLPAHGRSTGAGAETIQQYAQAMLALLDQLGISQVIPVGHSMGGAIAQTLALDYPKRCPGLILIGTAAKLSVNEQILNLALSDQAAAAGLINKWSWSVHAPAHFKQADLGALQTIPAAVLHGDYVACNRFDVTSRLEEFQMPVLILCGVLDKMTPPALSQAMAARISHATCHIIEQAGHWVTLEQPQQVAQRVSQWLREQQL